ncbi:MAG: 30S ribosomal protein S16 [Candidatus Uhrbacteria bacterium]
MLVIRLSRVGKKKQPSYRIVVQEKTQDPWSNFLENLGHYNPLTHPSTLVVKKERAQYWISKGAQPSDTVWNLFLNDGIVTGEKRNTMSISKKRRIKLDAKATEAAAIIEKKKEKEAAPKAEPEVAPAPAVEPEAAPEAAPGAEPQTEPEATPEPAADVEPTPTE